ncbi:MAG: OmpA family protein [Polyangia bacterium]
MRTLLMTMMVPLFLASAAQAVSTRHIVVESSLEPLGEIRFEGGSARLTADSQRQLGFAAQSIVDNPQLERIEVKAARLGLPAKLAQQRAESVRTYLHDHGVDEARLSTRVVPGADNSVELILL